MTVTGRPILFRSNYGWSTSDLNKLAAIPKGTKVSFTNVYVNSWGTTEPTADFTVDYVTDTTDYYGARMIHLYTTGGIRIDNLGNIGQSTSLRPQNITWNVTTNTPTITLAATKTGLDVLSLTTASIKSPASALTVSLNHTVPATITVPANSGSTSYQNWNGSYIQCATGDGFSQSTLNALANLAPGTLVTISGVDIQGYGSNYTLKFNIQSVYKNDLAMGVINLIPSTAVAAYMGSSFQFNLSAGTYFQGTQYSFLGTAVQEVSPISITPTGIDVVGDLTIGGQPYLPSDVVFNSALIGDVSIVSNTISGVDSYGNPDKLIVEGKFDVDFVTNTSSTLNWSSAYFNYDPYGSGPGYGSITFQEMVDGANWLELKNKFFTQPSGSVVYFTANDGYGVGNFRFTISGVSSISTDNYGFQQQTAFGVLEKYNQYAATPGWAPQYWTSLNSIVFTFGSTVVNNVLAVTKTGVNVTGDLKVNGQAVGGASASRGDISSLITFPNIDMSITYALPKVEASYIKIGKIVRVIIDVCYDPGTAITWGSSPVIALPFFASLLAANPSTKVLNNTLNGDAGVKYGAMAGTTGLEIKIDYVWAIDAMGPPSPARYYWQAISPMDTWAWNGKRHTIEVEFEEM